LEIAIHGAEANRLKPCLNGVVQMQHVCWFSFFFSSEEITKC